MKNIFVIFSLIITFGLSGCGVSNETPTEAVESFLDLSVDYDGDDKDEILSISSGAMASKIKSGEVAEELESFKHYLDKMDADVVLKEIKTIKNNSTVYISVEGDIPDEEGQRFSLESRFSLIKESNKWLVIDWEWAS